MRFNTLYVAILASLTSAAVIDLKIIVEDHGIVPSVTTLPDGCYWSGTAPTCEGECNIGETYCGRSGCGDGKCCASGWKVLCCKGNCPNDSLVQAFERVMADAHQAQHPEI